MFRKYEKPPTPQEQQAEEKLKLARDLAENEARQREIIRYECQLFYDRHAMDVKHRYSPRQFSAYLSEWMHDRVPVALVRERAENLKQMIREFLKPIEPVQQDLTRDDIQSHFLQIIREIEGRKIDRETKDAMIAEAYYAWDRALAARGLS
ncbi:MAG: hypothetical protein R3C18_13885 [Planctomycetaceae bacterium]